MNFNKIKYYIKFLLYNFLSFSITFTFSLFLLFTTQGLILTSGSFKNTEFPVLIGINNAILGINTPRPKTKESKGKGVITTSKLISFIASSIIHLEIMIFSIIVLITGQYTDNNQMTIYISMMITILTIYVSRPKYKPYPIEKINYNELPDVNIVEETELTE